MNTTVDIKAEALCKAALQAAARALHTAQLAADALKKASEGAVTPFVSEMIGKDADMMLAMRDRLLDAYRAIPDAVRERMLKSAATITSDELIDLLALCVRG